MKSPLKTIIVYDLETGGLSEKYNPITELAAVVISLETLEIIEEFSVAIKPRLNLCHIVEEPIKEAKIIFNNLAQKDEESGIKTLNYKGVKITLKTLKLLADDISFFVEFLKQRKSVIFSYEEYIKLQEGEFKNISKIYFNHSYNPKALEITHINVKLLLDEGLEFHEAYNAFNDLIKKHTSGSNKPIIAGHNIKAFDNPFTIKFFEENGGDFKKSINSFEIDTLEMVRLRWSELSSYSLGVCASALGLTLKEAHRALPDTIANAQLLIKLLQSLRSEGGEESTYTRKKYSLNY
jgi:DNA polymerase III alpha subunit (gram-positive type)